MKAYVLIEAEVGKAGEVAEAVQTPGLARLPLALG